MIVNFPKLSQIIGREVKRMLIQLILSENVMLYLLLSLCMKRS